MSTSRLGTSDEACKRRILRAAHRIGYVDFDEEDVSEADIEIVRELMRDIQEDARSAPVAVEVPEIEPELTEEPVVVEDFADNGAHSQWRLVDGATGKTLWEEACSIPPSRILKEGEAAVPVELLRFALDALRCSEPYVGCGYDHSAKYTTAIARLEDAIRSQRAAEGGEQ